MKHYLLPLMLVFSLKAFGYNFTEDFNKGFYWSNFPIVLSVEAPTDSTGANTLMDSVQDAAKEWNGQLAFDLFSVKGGTANVIKCSQKFSEDTGYSNDKTLAVTIRSTEYTYIARSVIIINDDYFKLCSTKSKRIRTVILHELGHAAGLGHSGTRDAIMYPEISSLEHLTNDDISGGKDLVVSSIDRKNSGYVSALISEDKESKALSCGTVALASDHDNFPGMMMPIISLIFGIFIVSVSRRSVQLVVAKIRI